MKTSHSSRLAILAATLAAASAVAPAVLCANSAIPSLPVGAMSAYPTVVQTGTKPTLNWNILYPSQVGDMVDVVPPGTLVPNDTVYVTVQIVGTGISTCDPTQGSAPLYTEVRLSLDGGPYVQLFYGVQADVNPSHLLYVKKVRKNDTINFAGRYVQKNGDWSSLYSSRGSGMRVVSMVNGDLPPTTFPLHQSPKLASYLAPYLDASGRVRIGPLSVLVMMELGQDDRTLECFDYQDQLLLVTFSKKHPNNGHGNNLDGVDVSNPGQGSGGPNGEIDPSGDIDDERK